MKMMNHVTRAETVDPPWKIASRLGFWSAVLTAVFAAAAFAMGITTPPNPARSALIHVSHIPIPTWPHSFPVIICGCIRDWSWR